MLNNCCCSEWVLSVQYLMIVQSILLEKADEVSDIEFLNIIHLLMYIIEERKNSTTILDFKSYLFENIMCLWFGTSLMDLIMKKKLHLIYI